MRLLVSQRYSDDARLLLQAARLRGWDAHRLHGSSVAPEWQGADTRVYAEGFLVEHLADQLNLTLLRPPGDALARLDRQFTARTI
jgi:hypothetical protein